MLKRAIISLVFLFLPAPGAAAGTIETLELKAPRGATVPVDIHWPDAPGPAPVVVLAPGQGYHKDLPLLRTLAEEAARSGFAAVRFNWAYCRLDPAKGECTGESSEDLLQESEDLRTVLDHLYRHARADAGRVLLAGKSLGSIVAWRAFRADTALRAVLLLTPVCVARDTTVAGGLRAAAGENYPGLAAETRPVVFVLGSRDRACPLPVLYAAAKDARGNVAVAEAAVHWMNLSLER